MIKFSSQVVWKQRDTNSLLISFDHDYFITLEGALNQILPLLDRGTTEEEILATLNSKNKNALNDFLAVLTSLGMLNTSESSVYHKEISLELGDLGQLKVELFPLLDPVFAPYKVDEA